MIARTEFLAPLMLTSPWRGFLPQIWRTDSPTGWESERAVEGGVEGAIALTSKACMYGSWTDSLPMVWQNELALQFLQIWSDCTGKIHNVQAKLRKDL
jgi:hypothetical protein